MNNSDLTTKYGSVLNTLKALKIYTILIIILGIASCLSGIPNIGLFMFVLSMNCFMNYLIFAKICRYFEMLNELLTKGNDIILDEA